MRYLVLILLAGCATINEDCANGAYPEDYDICVKEERARKHREEAVYEEQMTKACRQAGGVYVCDHWRECDCVDRQAVMIFR